MTIEKTTELGIGGYNSLQYCLIENITAFPINPQNTEITETEITVTGDGWQNIETINQSISPAVKKVESDAGTYFQNSLQCKINENNPALVDSLLALNKPVLLKYNNNRGRTFIMGTLQCPCRQLFDQPQAPGVNEFAGTNISFAANTRRPPLTIEPEEE
jgi:hypothetical protein